MFSTLQTGHCYTGRSSGEGSFAIWTGHLNDAAVVKNFVPQSTKQTPQTVISAGPAVNVQGLYEFGSANGLVTIGGFTQTVGATGGYVLGGGTGPNGPHFGLGVDNVVQFQVVLANGSVVIANAVLNKDLFWALRGGGGAFGVVTRVWLKTYSAFKTINTVSGVVQCADSASFASLISNIIDVQIPTRAAGQTVRCIVHRKSPLARVRHEKERKGRFANVDFISGYLGSKSSNQQLRFDFLCRFWCR